MAIPSRPELPDENPGDRHQIERRCNSQDLSIETEYIRGPVVDYPTYIGFLHPYDYDPNKEGADETPYIFLRSKSTVEAVTPRLPIEQSLELRLLSSRVPTQNMDAVIEELRTAIFAQRDEDDRQHAARFEYLWKSLLANGEIDHISLLAKTADLTITPITIFARADFYLVACVPDPQRNLLGRLVEKSGGYGTRERPVWTQHKAPYVAYYRWEAVDQLLRDNGAGAVFIHTNAPRKKTPLELDLEATAEEDI